MTYTEYTLDQLIPVTYQFKAEFDEIQLSRISFDRINSPFYKGDKWAVRRDGFCLNKESEWEYEVQPSSRDNDFYQRCRFDSLDEAIEAVNNIK